MVGYYAPFAELLLALPHPLAKLHPHLARVGIDRSLNSLTINFQKTIQLDAGNVTIAGEYDHHHGDSYQHHHVINQQHHTHQHVHHQRSGDHHTGHHHHHQHSAEPHASHHHHHHHHHHQSDEHQHQHHDSSDHHHHNVTTSTWDTKEVARRPRHSPYPMLPVTDAIDIVLREAIPMQNNRIVQVLCKDALGYHVAETVSASHPSPAFPASVKDGYAVIASDGAGLRRVVAGCLAGDTTGEEVIVKPGTCVRISTGAVVPLGADSVVQVEDTELSKATEDGLTELEIRIVIVPKEGQDIRPVGCDIAQGQTVLQAGCRLGPTELGLLASLGLSSIMCYRKPTVAIMSTGDELKEPGALLRRGQIHDSNRAMLIAQLQQWGFVAVDLGIAPDNYEELVLKLKAVHSSADILITSGGVSMGEKDLLKSVLINAMKATLHFGRVQMKPGKPTSFLTIPAADDVKLSNTLVFGLPGNPVSALVTCQLFILPALRKMSGHPEPDRQLKMKVLMTFDLELDPRPEYHRVVLSCVNENDLFLSATSTGYQLSSRLLSMKSANALLVLPSGNKDKTTIKRGDLVEAIVIDQLC